MKFILALIMALAVMPTSAQAHEITKEDVVEAQKEWAEGIENISKVYMEEGDYKQAATDHINKLYAYGMSEVLFKPTLAADDQFRETFDEALSYFVGGSIEEDTGFAIKPWTKVRFGEEPHIAVFGDYAVCMGNYFFTPKDSDVEQKVEFTFGYMKDKEGDLRINLHHSSLPFAPK